MFYMFCLYHFSLKCIIKNFYLSSDDPLKGHEEGPYLRVGNRHSDVGNRLLEVRKRHSDVRKGLSDTKKRHSDVTKRHSDVRKSYSDRLGLVGKV